MCTAAVKFSYSVVWQSFWLDIQLDFYLLIKKILFFSLLTGLLWHWLHHSPEAACKQSKCNCIETGYWSPTYHRGRNPTQTHPAGTPLDFWGCFLLGQSGELDIIFIGPSKINTRERKKKKKESTLTHPIHIKHHSLPPIFNIAFISCTSKPIWSLLQQSTAINN